MNIIDHDSLISLISYIASRTFLAILGIINVFYILIFGYKVIKIIKLRI